ncbi:hypothetical protein PoB_000465500 [Plakobranchus ocellatus]|uniref:Uncharacterized protein n=1 Tax=Plakobranchus ocellatus TaxID=259542 RepID=A0AAV3Y5Q0_9GAST|nr:hypothetical protein PoB_000465500 [Plakobranchus ocellatus]
MKYVNKRGGYINIEWIPRSTCYEDLLITLKGRTGLSGVIKALNETRDSNSHALKVHSLAMEHPKTSDPHVSKIVTTDTIIASQN